MALAVSQTTQVPCQVLLAQSASTEQGKAREDICKAVSMLTACTKAIDDLPEFILVQALAPLFSQMWPCIKQVLQARASDPECAELCCDYLQRNIKALCSSSSSEITQSIASLFQEIQTALLGAFVTNSKNFKCLETYAFACQTIGGKIPAVNAQIGQNLDELCTVVAGKLLKPAKHQLPNLKQDFIERVDTDVATAYASLLCKIIDMNAEAVASCRSLPDTLKFFCEALSYVQQKELTKKIVLLFLHMAQSVPQRLSVERQRIVISFYSKIVHALMAAVSNERGSSLQEQLAQCFVDILTQAESLGQSEVLR